ncbi:MAG: sporulation protein YqfD [Clostridiales bacterium]|nr:sporulation protein YqfD [Clostridiales bacterium]
MLKFIKFFHGYLYVYVSGYSPERFLNLCSRMNIVLWGLSPDEDGYCFYISRKAFSLIDPALRKSGTQVQVVRQIGLPFLIRKYRKHSFFFVGICCAAVLLYGMSLFIWNVEIEGNSYYSTQTILDYLDKNGIGYASRKANIDCKELQTMLRKDFEEMAWVSAKIEGTRLYLVIQESVNGSADESEEDTGTALSLVAKNSGIVESVVVRRGTPAVAAGDTVEAGDTLVSGIVEILNDDGEVAARHSVAGDADVWILTSLPYEDSFESASQEKVLTGQKKLRFTFCFGSRFVNLLPEPDGDDVLVLEENLPVVIGSDFYLPVRIIKSAYLSFEIHTTEYTEEEIETLAAERLEQYCENLEENGVQILSNRVIIERSGKKILVQGDLEALVYQDQYEEITQTEEGELPDGTDTADDGYSE